MQQSVLYSMKYFSVFPILKKFSKGVDKQKKIVYNVSVVILQWSGSSVGKNASLSR